VNELEQKLKENQWLTGSSPTVADKEAYEELKDSLVSAKTHPHTFGWFCIVQKFTEATRNSWPAAGAPAAGGKGGKGGKKGKDK